MSIRNIGIILLGAFALVVLLALIQNIEGLKRNWTSETGTIKIENLNNAIIVNVTKNESKNLTNEEINASTFNITWPLYNYTLKEALLKGLLDWYEVFNVSKDDYELYNNTRMGYVLLKPKNWSITESMGGYQVIFLSPRDSPEDNFSENFIVMVTEANNVSNVFQSIDLCIELERETIEKMGVKTVESDYLYIYPALEKENLIGTCKLIVADYPNMTMNHILCCYYHTGKELFIKFVYTEPFTTNITEYTKAFVNSLFSFTFWK